MSRPLHLALSLLSPLLMAPVSGCAPSGADPLHDLVIRNGLLYDGSGGAPRPGGVAVDGDTIVRLGSMEGVRGRVDLDAAGMAVAPGFINMLSWATESLLVDGRSLSDIKQGVTLEVFGEGWSMGPLREEMKAEAAARQGDLRYEIAWTTLGEYLDHLVDRGVSTNIASFVGATTVRIHVLGHEDRAPTPDELDRMQDLVRHAMAEGAMGVGSSLIYAPAFYADTEELIALAAAAGESGGSYITHMRSEGGRLLEAVDEVIRIAREAGVPAEIYHLKAAGSDNWHKLDQVIEKIEAARASGIEVSADMYTYTAGATGLDAAMPPWVQEGGHDAWVRRLRDPEVRTRLRREMAAPSDDWENLLAMAGSPERVMLVEFRNEALKPLTGKTLAEVAAMRGKSPEDVAMDLVVEDDSRVGAIYFLMSEENVRRQVAIPWMSFGSDAASQPTDGVFARSHPHPRTYGNFARLLGRYVRDESLLSLEEAIRKLTSQPARRLRLHRRGRLTEGAFADIVVFDPGRIQDRATFTAPHALAGGVEHVVVNGELVLRDGEHTGARPGRVVRGPGWRPAGESRPLSAD